MHLWPPTSVSFPFLIRFHASHPCLTPYVTLLCSWCPLRNPVVFLVCVSGVPSSVPIALPTAVPTMPTSVPTPVPTAPTAAPTAVRYCPAYTASNTNSDQQNYVTCAIYACPGAFFVVDTCQNCNGDTLLRLYDAKVCLWDWLNPSSKL